MSKGGYILGEFIVCWKIKLIEQTNWYSNIDVDFPSIDQDVREERVKTSIAHRWYVKAVEKINELRDQINNKNESGRVILLSGVSKGSRNP